MTKVFIGGSRRISRLNADVRRRLDRIVEKGLAIVVVDASGADKAVQQYLRGRGYERVEVFCSNGECRNNLGGWEMRSVPTPKGTRGIAFYSVKDEEMAREGTVGLMLWDGRSKGTLANMERLLKMKKKVVVYYAPNKVFFTLRSKKDLETLLSLGGKATLRKPRRAPRTLEHERYHVSQVSLF